MRIGELARRAAVHVQTVRYYERLKLLRAPERSLSGYRNYEAADLERVQFIRRTQELGFSLEEIRGLVAAHTDYLRQQRTRKEPVTELRFIIEMFEQKENEIAAKITELGVMREKLRGAIEQLMQTVPQCPVSSTPSESKGCPHDPTRNPSGFAANRVARKVAPKNA